MRGINIVKSASLIRRWSGASSPSSAVVSLSPAIISHPQLSEAGALQQGAMQCSSSNFYPSATSLEEGGPSARFTSNERFERFASTVIDIVNPVHRVSVPRLASLMCDKDEDYFEEAVSSFDGGLLGFCKVLHAQGRLLLTQHQQNEGGLQWVVEKLPQHKLRQVALPQVALPQVALPPVHTAPEAPFVTQAVVSPTQSYWDSFDAGYLIPYIPDSRFVSWQVLSALLPEASLHDMPKEQRSKNVARILRPFTDIVLVPFLMFRLNAAGRAHPLADPQGATILLSGILYDDTLVEDVVQHVANEIAATSQASSRQGVPLAALMAPGSDLEAVLRRCCNVVTAKTVCSVVRMYPTVLTTFTVRGHRFVAALRRPVSVGAAASAAESYIRRCAEVVRRILTTETQSVFPNPCSVERLGQWLADDQGIAFGDVTYDGTSNNKPVVNISDLLSIAADILPINEDGMITLAIARQENTPDGLDIADKIRSKPAPLWVRPLPPQSCVGLMPQYTIPSDTELDCYVTIDKGSRWSSLRKSAKKKGKVLKCSSLDHSTGVVSIMRAKCPVTEFLSIADAASVIPRELMATLPTSFLSFLDDRPQEFELIERFSGAATDYFVRVREVGEEVPPGTRQGIAAGTFSEGELLSFIDHAISGARGAASMRASQCGTKPLKLRLAASSSISNAWAKLPLSVRKQFHSIMRNFVAFLLQRPEMFSLDAQQQIVTLRITQE